MYFTTLVALVILLPNHSNWFSTAINWMCFFTYIHAIATCLLYLFPELYRYILPMLNESVFLDGYKSGLTIHYSTNGIYLGIGCVICWCRIMHSSPKRASRIILGIIVAIALFLTTKRAHVLFGVLAILIVYMCGNKRGLTRWMKLLFIMVVGAITFLLLSRIIPELRDVIDRFLNVDGGDITTGRFRLYDLAWQMFLQKPLLGWGWGEYMYQYSIALGSSWFQYNDAHNVFLQTLAEGGVVLFIAFTCVTVGTMIHTIRQLQSSITTHSSDQDSVTMLLSVALGIQVFFLLYCITGNPLYDIQCQIPYGISCAISYAVAYIEHQKKENSYVKKRHIDISSSC